MMGEFMQDAIGKLWKSLSKGASKLGEEPVKRLERDTNELEKQFAESPRQNAEDRVMILKASCRPRLSTILGISCHFSARSFGTE